MMNYCFKIAGKIFKLTHCQEIKITKNFMPFQVDEKAKADCTIRFCEKKKLTFIEDSPVFSNISFEVQTVKDGFIRQYRDYKEGNCLYAISHIAKNGRDERVEYLPEFSCAFSESQNSFSHIAIDELLVHQSRMILHASLIKTDVGGILFSGPSGVGKSTQAELWKKLEDAEIINGDRPILGKESGVWKAWGSPYAGTSGFYVAKEIPISAIVVISQGKENTIKKLDVSTAFRKLYSEVTVNTWNSCYINRVIDMLHELSLEIPIYQFACTPDEVAVQTLKEKLKREVV